MTEAVMVAVTQWNSPVFTEAVLVWTGYGRDRMPKRDDAAVVSRFGVGAAAELLPAIKSLIDEFYLSDAKFTAANLIEMGRIATEEFKAKRPEIADQVLQAFSWCYTFDFR